MDSLSNMPYTHQGHISFSFDQASNQNRYERSISQCLRLQTHQSIQDKHQSSIEMLKKSMKSDERDTDKEHCKRLLQQQYQLRIESMTKQYELRLSKQQEYFELREWKLKEQLQNLQKQNTALAQELKRSKINPRQLQSNCSICGNGQIIAHYNKILTQNEEHHRYCLQQKKEMISKLQETTAKLQTIEQEHEKVCEELRTMNKQIRMYQSKNRQLQSERDDAITQRDNAVDSLAQIESHWKGKVIRLQNQSKQLQKQIVKKNKSISHSKITVQSSQSRLSNQQFSLKSSFLRPRECREQKENQVKRGRSSLNKGTIQGQQDQSRVCLQKISQNVPRYSHNAKHEALRWKYF